MDRAYQSGAAGSAPSAPASPSTGYPTAGNPGTGTQATKPGPYWYHMIMEELMAIISAAGITPAQGNLTQLLTALRSAGVIQTQSQFDNTTKAATTAYVQQMLGNMSAAMNLSVSTVMDSTHFGKFVEAIVGGITITLPVVSASNSGGRIEIHNITSSDITISSSGGVSILGPDSPGGGTSFTLRPGTQVTMVSTSSQWRAINGAGAASLGASGYQRLPSGLIVQWGTYNTSGTSTPAGVIFPIAFPTACYSVAVSPVSVLTMATANSVSGISTSGFSVLGVQLQPSSNNYSAHTGNYIAIGR